MHRWLRILLASAALVDASVSRGQEGVPAGAVTESRTVTIALVGIPDEPTFPERLRSWFSSDVVLDFKRESTLDPDRVLRPRESARAEVWVTVRAMRTARVYFVVPPSQGSSQRFLVRDIDLENGFDEVGKERLAQVVHTSLLALWEGRAESPRAEIERQLVESVAEPAGQKPKPVSRPAAVPTRTAPAPKDDARRPVAMTAAVGYGANLRGDERWAHGPELMALLHLGPAPLAVGGFMAARYLAPVTPSEAGVRLTIDGARLRVGGALRYGARRSVRLEAGLGGGADIVRYEARGNEQVDPLPADSEVRAAVSAQVGLSYWLRPVTLLLLGTVDVSLQDTHYDIVRADGRERVIEPWQVQPGVSLLVGWE